MAKTQTLLSPAERIQAQALGELGFTNPFTRRRIELERQALGTAYVEAYPIWVVEPQRHGTNPNVPAIEQRAATLAEQAHEHVLRHGLAAADRRFYEELVLYALYSRYEHEVRRAVADPDADRTHLPAYKLFRTDVERLFAGTGLEHEPRNSPERLFALLFQLRRAFHLTFRSILGTSAAATALRVEVWHAIFTHDLRRFRESLYRRIHEVSTLIVGASGTGKELVAAAIAQARFIPLDPRTGSFVADFHQCFTPVHLAALPTTTIESELFGHRKGAFTGAVADRKGYLETSHDTQSVFLDEIGELAPEVQVKLLRVLQNRTFQALGDTQPRHFYGKILSATNRDLAAEIAAGRFRTDLYYRLCSDIIRTPTLAEQIAGDRDELGRLIDLITERIADPDVAPHVARDAHGWVDTHLRDHSWPGNMRELEQCVRSVMVRGHYAPLVAAGSARGEFARDVEQASLDHATLLSRYYALAYAATGSYEGAARRIKADRRTVKARMDRDFLARLQRR
jgi:hypothetical protein